MKKTTKISFSIFCCILLAFLLLGGSVAFASGETEKASGKGQEKVSLTFWYGSPEDKGPAQLIDEYEDLNPNVEIEFVQLAYNDEADMKLVTALMSGESVDVYTPTRNHYDKITSGLALELTDFLEKDGIVLEEEIGPGVSEWTFNDKHYAIPTYTFSSIFFLNQEMFQKAGLEFPSFDWTMSDYQELASKLTKGQGSAKQYGAYITSNWKYFWLYPYFRSFREADIFNEDFTESNFNDPAIVKALELYIKMSEEDGSIPTFSETVAEKYFPNQMYLGEKAAMVLSQDYLLRSIKDRQKYPHSYKTGFVELPRDPAFNRDYRLYNVSGPTIINPKSKNIDASWEFLKWFFHDGCKHVAALSGKLPSYKGFSAEEVTQFMVEGSEDLIDFDTFEKIYAARMDDRPISYMSKGPGEAKEILVQQAEKALVGDMSVKAALDEAKKKADILLKQMAQ